MTDHDAAPTAELTPQDQATIRQILGRMPYLPLVLGHVTNPRTVAELAGTLDRLAEVLRVQGERHTAAVRDLDELHSDVTAMRRVLGTTRP